MHLQQTKRGSIATGGAQYYFHDLSAPVVTYLRQKGAVRVALVTPYGATKSNFFAVGNFERIDLDVQIVEDIFYVLPLRCKCASRSKTITLPVTERPLTFTLQYQSPFWRQQITSVDHDLAAWSLEEICRIVKDHRPATKLAHIQEPDILRAAGPLREHGCLTSAGFRTPGYAALPMNASDL